MDFNHKMVKLARLARGKTLDILSKDTKIDKALLSKMESALLMPSDTQISQIATALDFPISFFSEDISEARYSDFFYRKRVTMPVKEKDSIDAQIDIIRYRYDRLTEQVDIPETKIFTFPVDKGFTPENIANMAREYYEIGKGPVLNLIGKLEKNGIGVVYLDTESERFDGLTTYTQKGYPVIILNKSKSNDRKRFTLCHELGHIIMHFPFRFKSDFYERIKDSKDNIFEAEADRFASEFLMPSTEVFNDLQRLTYGKLSLLKQYWNVSKASIVYKAKSLGVIDQSRYSSLMIELSRNGERKNEIGGITIDEPKMLTKLFDYYRDINYTDEQVCQLLKMSPYDLDAMRKLHNGNKLRISF